MLAAVLLLSLCAQLGFSAPSRCTIFCDEEQLSAGYLQNPVQQRVQVPTSYNFFRPSNARYVQAPARIETFDTQPVYGGTFQAPTYVQPAHTEVFEPVNTHVASVPSHGNVEGVIYHSSSTSHNSQTHGMLRYPAVQTGKYVTQYEPIRTQPCLSPYVDPCTV